MEYDRLFKLQNEVQTLSSVKKKTFDYVIQLYDRIMNKSKKRQSDSGLLMIKDRSYESAEEMQEIFVYLNKLMRQVEKNEDFMNNFNKTKQKFIEDFENETKELTQKWQELNQKRLAEKQ